jgi:hypothetical protein
MIKQTNQPGKIDRKWENASVRFTKCAAIFIAALLHRTTRKFLQAATCGEAVYQRVITQLFCILG